MWTLKNSPQLFLLIMCCVFLKNKGVETVSQEQEMVSKNVDLQKNPTEVQK